LDPPQRDGSSACEVHVVRAERSTRWPAETESALVKRSETAGSRLRYHVLPNAGHWLHVDNPVGLRDVIAPELARLHGSLA
jgi:pimeloyl-ACP methyl ester carboxylesterase